MMKWHYYIDSIGFMDFIDLMDFMLYNFELYNSPAYWHIGCYMLYFDYDYYSICP